MEDNSIKYYMDKSYSDYRHIWNEIAPKRSSICWIICYVLLILSTRGILDINYGMGILGFVIIAVVMLVRFLHKPLKVKKYLVSNLSEDIIISDNVLYVGDKYIFYSNINKIIDGKRFVYIKAYKLQLVFTFADERDKQFFYNELKIRCKETTTCISAEKRKKIKIGVATGALVLYIAIAISLVYTIASYDATVAEYTEKFKETYNIELHILNNSEKIHEYEIDNVSSKYSVLSSLKTIDKTLERFPEDIFRELNFTFEGIDVSQEKLSLIISGDIDNRDKNRLDAAGLTSTTEEGFDVYIDCNGFTIENTFAHEMCHVLMGAYEDYNIDNLVDIFLPGKGWSGDYEGWTELNPLGFVYYEDRGDGNTDGWRFDWTYTKREKDKYNIYFVTEYSKASDAEDMAEIFKYLVTCDSSLPAAYDSPHIQAKAKLLIQWLDEKYESVDEDVYWNKWFKE
ncbi:MAG: hypothetical protein IJV71_01955 [Lachnospiraceae bacterium]|nr:hypothetical protein [Lachnospiraceae bacterium]